MDICKMNPGNTPHELNVNRSAKRKTLHALAYRTLLNGHCRKFQHNSTTTERSGVVESASTKHRRVDSEVKQDELPSMDASVEGPLSRSTDMDREMASGAEKCEKLHSDTDRKGIYREPLNSPAPGSPHSSLREPPAVPKTAPRVKPTSPGHEEYWVPVHLSNVQLEQYCATLIDNSKILCCNVKREASLGLHDILLTVRKCADHPYLVNRSLESILNKDRPTVDFLDTGIQVSGKLQLLNEFLPLIKERGLRVLILFQSCSLGKKTLKIGDILDDFLFRKFGENSYVHIYPGGREFFDRSKRPEALNLFNRESERFVILMEKSSCYPSIKISLLDIVILFNSDWDPFNDMRTLQRITLQPQFSHVKVFRLFVPCTVEEKALALANEGTPLDSRIPQFSYNVYNMLLLWGAKYLFGQLSSLHSSTTSTSDLVICSEQAFLSKVLGDLLSVLSCHAEGDNADCSFISKMNGCSDGYQRNAKLFGQIEVMSVDEVPPHAFWGGLFNGACPTWKFLPDRADKERRRGQPVDSLPHESNDGKETVMWKNKVTDFLGLESSLNSRLGPRRKMNSRIKGNMFKSFMPRPFALKASSVKESSVPEGACQRVQSSSCLVNNADRSGNSDASSSILQMSREKLRSGPTHRKRKRKRTLDSRISNFSCRSQSGLTSRKRKRSLDSENINIPAPIKTIAIACERRLMALLQKQKEEIKDFFKTTRKHKEMLEEEYQLESSLICGTTAAEQAKRAKLDQKFKEKLDRHLQETGVKMEALKARHHSERTYEKSLWGRLLDGQQEDSAGAAVAVVPVVMGTCVPGEGDEVSPRCSVIGPAALSVESNGENDSAVIASEKTADSSKKQPHDVFNVGPSKELKLVLSSERVTEDVENIAEKEQDDRIEHLDDPCKELLNETVSSLSSGDDLSALPRKESNGVLMGETSGGLMGENSLSSAPVASPRDSNSDCGMAMNVLRDDIVCQQPATEPSNTETPALRSSLSPVAVEQSACTPCPEPGPGPFAVSISSVVPQNNGVVSQDQASIQRTMGNVTMPSTLSLSSSPVNHPSLLASGIAHHFPDNPAPRFQSGSANNIPPSQRFDPLRLELQKLYREEEESVQKHGYAMKMLQAAYLKEMEEMRKKYEALVKSVDNALLQKKNDLKTRCDVVLSHVRVSDFMRLVASSSPELSFTAAHENVLGSPSVLVNQSQQPSSQSGVQCPGPSTPAMRPAPVRVVNTLSDLISADAPTISTVPRPATGGYQPRSPPAHLRQHGPLQQPPPPGFSLLNNRILNMHPLHP